MSRLTAFDKALVLILVPLWAVCFGLAVRTQVLGGGFAVLELVAEDSSPYPKLTGQFSSVVHRSDPLAEAGLRPGDRLVRVGNADLHGIGTLGFLGLAQEEAGRDISVPLVFERNGERLETSLALAPVSIVRPLLAGSFAYAASALFLLLRGRPTPCRRCGSARNRSNPQAQRPFG